MMKFLTLFSAFVFTIAIPHEAARAHGGLSMDKDICKLTISPEYSMHMSGYIPDDFGGFEFCEDIPQKGRVIVVFDMLQTHLRQHETEVRIVKDMGPDTDIEANTIMLLPFQKYKTGTLHFDHTYEEKGKYIGIVSVRDHDRLYVSKFPFSVGFGDNKKHAKQIGYTAAIVLAFLAFAAWHRARGDRKRSSRAPPA